MIHSARRSPKFRPAAWRRRVSWAWRSLPARRSLCRIGDTATMWRSTANSLRKA